MCCVNVSMLCGQALVTVAVAYNWFVILLRVAFEDMRCSVSLELLVTGLRSI